MTEDLHKGSRIRSYFEAEAQSLRERIRIIETLLPAPRGRGSAHRGEEGRHIESLLRDFLNRHLPAQLRALSGFILRPSTKTGRNDLSRLENETDEHSSQLDIIVYDVARFPVYERFEEFIVAPPEGVVGIISVKKRLRVNTLPAELTSLAHAAQLCRSPQGKGPYLGLFAFAADEPPEKLGAAIFNRIQQTLSNKPFCSLINEVSVFDKLVVFKFSPEDSPPGQAKFVQLDCTDMHTKTEALHLPIQRILQSLLGVHHDPSRGTLIERPGFASFYRGQFNKAPLLGYVPVSD